MVNKRNKTNKKNKKNSRKYRRVSKKMYGGFINPPQGQTLVSNANSGVNMLNPDIKLNSPEISTSPLELQEDANNQTFTGKIAHKIEDKVGSIVGNIKNNIQSASDVADSPEALAAIHEFSEKGKDILTAARPLIEQSEQILEKGVIDTVKTGTEAGIAAANMFPPIEALNAVADFVKEGAILGKTALAEASVLFKSKNLIKPIENLVTDFKDKTQSFTNLAQNASAQAINTKNALNSVTQIGDTQQIGNNSGEHRYGRPELNGGSLKNIRKQSKMIGGRCRKAQDEFLHPQLVLSQLIQPHKRKTRRNKR